MLESATKLNKNLANQQAEQVPLKHPHQVKLWAMTKWSVKYHKLFLNNFRFQMISLKENQGKI